MKEQWVTIGRGLFAVLLLLGLAACATQHTESDRMRFDVRDDAAPRLRGQQSIAVRNAYGAPANVVVFRQGENRVMSDLKELTDTAIAILERRMKKDGVVVDQGAAKSILLRMAEPSVLIAGPFAVLSTVTFEAQLGDGEKRVFRVKNNTNNVSRALDGAALRGVVELLNDEQFLAYVNGL